MSALLDLATATWPEAEAHARRALLLPLGALEQHGPHLPLDTDARIAAAVASAAATQRPGIGVAPALPVGASGEHAAFPGTLSMGTRALATVLVELGRDATGHWGALLLVNAHGGNADAIRLALATLRAEGRNVGVFHAAVPGGDAHAGRTETSLLLHLAPELVRAGPRPPGETRNVAELMSALRRDGVRAVSATGVLGDPTDASAAEGAKLFAALAAACAERVAALLGETP